MDNSIVNKWIESVQSWWLPPVCVLCGARGEAGGLCAGCRHDLPWQAKSCGVCALPLASGEVCGRCLARPPPRDEALAVFEYGPPVDALIHRVKFNGDLACARVLGLLMVEGVLRRCLGNPACAWPDRIVPVPLHRRRLATRGYNQAVELARPLARVLRAPLEIEACLRSRETAEQSGLDAAARAANLRDAFVARGVIDGDIAIVDDVMTTGHTVDALARVLRRAGAARVRVWVCARALPPAA